ncbi:DUF2703 domain-containing protein [Candidatus Micrarchaeota archaeon]|nr:DUF2703 domain-containing protein [Candidatus Micrarchaeota archaeon]
MDVKLYHTQTCHIWSKALEELKKAFAESGVRVEIKTIVVNTQEEAEQHRFLGSPTLHVNGRDVDPMAEKMTRYGLSACRTYWWKGKSFEYPPEEMVLQALKTET